MFPFSTNAGLQEWQFAQTSDYKISITNSDLKEFKGDDLAVFQNLFTSLANAVQRPENALFKKHFLGNLNIYT